MADTSDRAARRLEWARAALSAPSLELESASSDASFRSYWRTRGRAESCIVMDAPPMQEDVRPWIDVARRLRAVGLNAPRIEAENVEEGFLAISDLGTRLLLPELDDASVDGLYRGALDALFVMVTRADTGGLPRYDESRLVAEMELMPTWFLQRHLGYTPECEEWDVIESAFRVLVDSATRQPQAFVHRDFHSRNLLVATDSRTGPGIIDFQDAVLGPITYDLVSLLRDCYISWPEARVASWTESFRERLAAAGIVKVDSARFRQWFDLMGLQRHLKVLGIFCRLWYRDGKPGYLGDLARVWAYTRDVGNRYPQIAPLIALLETRIGDRDLARAVP